MRKLKIDEMVFRQAFDRDVNFHDAFPVDTYLDVETGGILWLYEDYEDTDTELGPAHGNPVIREQIAASPDRYLKIPGLTHGILHDILKEFLGSDWTDDQEAKNAPRNAYFGSIGGWKKNIDDETIFYAFLDFRDCKTKMMAEEFLRKHGIDPEWK